MNGVDVQLGARVSILPPPATKPRKHRGPCYRISLCICSILAVLIALCSITIMVYWIVVQPHNPRFYVSNFQLKGLPQQTQSSTSTHPNTTLSFQIVYRNPNKKAEIEYGDSSVQVISRVDGTCIASIKIPAFSQPKKNTTTFEETLPISKSVANTLLGSKYNLADLPVRMKINVKTRLRVGSTKTLKLKRRGRCDLDVNVSSSNQMLLNENCWVK